MAGRHPRNELAAKELARSLKRLAKMRQGSPRDIELETYATSGVKILGETVRKAFAGQVDPNQCSVELLLAFTSYYGVGPDQLGGFAARRIASVLSLTSFSPPDQEVKASRWKERTAGQRLAAVA